MRILQLAPRLPYPLTDGGAIGIYKITESVAALGNQVTLLTYPDPDPDITKSAISAMSQFCDLRLTSKPLPSRLKTIVRTLFRGAYSIERREMEEMYALIGSVIREQKFDIVHCDHSQMGKYALWIKKEFGLPVLLRQHNVEAQIYERFALHASNPASRRFGRIQSQRLHFEEKHFVKGVDGVAAISDEDAAIMKNYAPQARICVIPAGVDLDFFQPSDSALEDPDAITWCGRFAWEPNIDAVQYFLKEIFPLILKKCPSSVFHIIGAGSEKIAPLTKPFGQHIVIHGFVKDIREYLSSASVLIVPLRIGGGMRIKILEFCAAGKAIVSTRIGAEGNLAIDGRDILLRDDAVSFSEAVTTLLTDKQLRKKICINSRKLVEDHYSWNLIGKQFCAMYDDILSEK